MRATGARVNLAPKRCAGANRVDARQDRDAAALERTVQRVGHRLRHARVRDVGAIVRRAQVLEDGHLLRGRHRCIHARGPCEVVVHAEEDRPGGHGGSRDGGGIARVRGRVPDVVLVDVPVAARVGVVDGVIPVQQQRRRNGAAGIRAVAQQPALPEALRFPLRVLPNLLSLSSYPLSTPIEKLPKARSIGSSSFYLLPC